MFTFEDLSSKRIQTELGETYSNQPRVLPSTYNIKGNTITFSGIDKQVGRGSFDEPTSELDIEIITFNTLLPNIDLSNITFSQNSDPMSK